LKHWLRGQHQPHCCHGQLKEMLSLQMKMEQVKNPICFLDRGIEAHLEKAKIFDTYEGDYQYYKFIEDGPEEKKVSIPRIWSNIIKHDKPMGQVIVLEAFQPFKQADFEMMKLISQVISMIVQNNRDYDELVDTYRDKLIIDLIQGKIIDKTIIEERLRFSEWRKNHHLQVLTITNDKHSMSNTPFNYINGFFIDLLPKSFCIEYEGYVIVIIEREQKREFTEKQLALLDQFMEDTGLYCGLSRVFTDLSDLKKYFKQSLLAMKNGEKKTGNSAVNFYNDATLDYVFSICSKVEPLKELCHPAIFDLSDYDQVHGTTYMNTLYSYIINFGKTTEISQKVHLHRNTLYYRIGKIEEIIKMKLSNLDDFFLIYFSFKILEYIEDDLMLKLKPHSRPN
jgi:sugar diacid utilization regulator